MSSPSNNSPKAGLKQKLGFLNPILRVGGAVLKSGKVAVTTVGRAGKTVGTEAVEWIDRSTHGAGQVMTYIGDNPLLKNPVARKLAGVLKLDWLIGMSQQIDLNEAETQVRELQQRYPDESPREIAHRLMVQKAFYAGSTGLASSMIPGVAAALLAIDLAATTALQTEMLYQIAAAYGLDLKDPARRGEVLAIFGLALGGSNALRAGLGFLRNVPLAGALIGAGTNATMLYSLGYAACRFYEAKLEGDASEQPTPETLKTIQQDSEQYLAIAMAQQAVVDQILVHMILASYPDKKWEDILPELQALQFDSDSLETISQNLKAPQPIGALLQQLNCDFAVPLLAQCRRVAESHEGISEAETEVIEAIEHKCSGQLT